MSEVQKCVGCGSLWVVNQKYKLCEDCNYIRLHGISYRDKLIQDNKTKTITIKVKSKKCTKNKPKRNIVRDRDRETYREVFESRESRCEECGIRLPDQFEDSEGRIIMIEQYSHCLSKGAYCEYRHKSWNIQRLCLRHHQQWEFGDRKSMRIYPIYREIIIKNTSKDLLR